MAIKKVFANICYAIYYPMHQDHLAKKIVELCWVQYENPLFTLAFCVDPKYMELAKKFKEHQDDMDSLFSISCMSKAATAYNFKSTFSNQIVQEVWRGCRGNLKKLKSDELDRYIALYRVGN
jgi:hypothetical protein